MEIHEGAQMLKLIGIEEATKEKLDNLKEHKRATYEDIVSKLISDSENKQEDKKFLNVDNSNLN